MSKTLTLEGIRKSAANNLKDAGEREAYLVSLIDKPAALDAKPATAQPGVTTATGSVTSPTKAGTGIAAFLASIDAGASATFEPTAKTALDGIITAAAKLTPVEANAPGVRGLMAFIGRVSNPEVTGRRLTAIGTISAISAARRGMIK